MSRSSKYDDELKNKNLISLEQISVITVFVVIIIGILFVNAPNAGQATRAISTSQSPATSK